MLSGLQRIVSRIATLEQSLQALQPAASSTTSAKSASFSAALSTAQGSLASPRRETGPAATYDALIQAAARRHGVDPDLIHAVIRAESDYNPRCTSHAGAMGLMQLMPETVKDMGITDPFDPAQSIEGGTRELAGYLERFDTLELALAAYNAGPGAVRRYGGVPPYRETQAYLRHVRDYLAERKQGGS